MPVSAHRRAHVAPPWTCLSWATQRPVGWLLDMPPMGSLAYQQARTPFLAIMVIVNSCTPHALVLGIMGS
ncbi:hypothetical protein BCR44DRAFT_1447833 [Catenaria anguillulae PL171]|uniref:Uncharacterized protein n=1 Tax=Catenaria anguillulae PL171 TaxID=765915 RepID=A0A1Y2H5C9_9FUNG|nr:hypothetical protein BCR44DRAFT_1447833 [Catenaria anguillulae PL171]